MGTSATVDFPGITVEIDMVTGANTAAATWTDVTTYVRSFGIRRGRQRELDRFEAGTARLVLDNLDRRFDPEYAAGPYFGNLLPMRQIRIRAVWSAVTYDLFRGYIDGWPQAYPGYDADSIVTIEATDGFKVLALAPVDTPWSVEVSSDNPYSWYPLSETFGTIAGDVSGNGKHGTFSAAVIAGAGSIIPYVSSGSLQFDGVDDLVRLPAATAFPTARPTTVEVWCRDQAPTASPNGSLVCGFGDVVGTYTHLVVLGDGTVSFNYSTASVLQYVQSSIAVNDGESHHIVATVAAGNVAPIIYIDGVDRSTAAITANPGTHVISNLNIGANFLDTNFFQGFIDDTVIYNTALSAATVLDHYNAGANPWAGDSSGTRVGRVLDAVAWPAGLRDIDTGTSLLGPASWDAEANALQILQEIAQTETALMYMTGAGSLRFVGRNNIKTEALYTTSNATFGDSGAELDYSDIVTSYSDQLIRNVAKVSRRGGIQQTYEDTTSKAAYGPRTIVEDGLLMATDNEAYDRAVWRVLIYKDPAWRVDALVMKGRKSASTLWPQLLNRELGERVTVVRRPQGIGSSISKAVHIEGVEHEVSASAKTWDTTWYVSPTDPLEASWGIVGSGAAKNQVGTAKVSY